MLVWVNTVTPANFLPARFSKCENCPANPKAISIIGPTLCYIPKIKWFAYTDRIVLIFGYGAMSGAVGGGGLGNMAIQYGYNRHRPLVMYTAAVLLIILVQIFQSIGSVVTRKSDKRLRS